MVSGSATCDYRNLLHTIATANEAVHTLLMYATF